MSDPESSDLEDIAKLVPKYQLKIGKNFCPFHLLTENHLELLGITLRNAWRYSDD